MWTEQTSLYMQRENLRRMRNAAHYSLLSSVGRQKVGGGGGGGLLVINQIFWLEQLMDTAVNSYIITVLFTVTPGPRQLP